VGDPTPHPERSTEIVFDDDSPAGYRRTADLQEQFDLAAQRLLNVDGWPNPQRGDAKELVADLALEGGGVKGIGLAGAVLVLDEAGYRFRGVAGTSAGAIAASLVVGLSKAPDHHMTELRSLLDSLVFTNFMPEGKLHELWHHAGTAGEGLFDAAVLLHRTGLYSGDYLVQWLTPILDGLGVRTYADLKLTLAEDPGLSLAPGHDYRLVVHVSDITRGQLVHLPWDYPFYGHHPDGEEVVPSIRASMSIPFFFEPVTFDTSDAVVDIPRPGGGSRVQHFEAGQVTWVDGGMLQNFPINAFDRVDGKPPRWPTIGIRLSSLQTTFPPTEASRSTLAVATRCLHTLMNEWDAYQVDEQTAGRTIFVDNAGMTATDFHLTEDQKHELFLNGVSAATQFVIDMARIGGVPRTAEQSRAALLRG
jgi:NTE family protein